MQSQYCQSWIQFSPNQKICSSLMRNRFLRICCQRWKTKIYLGGSVTMTRTSATKQLKGPSARAKKTLFHVANDYRIVYVGGCRFHFRSRAFSFPHFWSRGLSHLWSHVFLSHVRSRDFVVLVSGLATHSASNCPKILLRKDPLYPLRAY